MIDHRCIFHKKLSLHVIEPKATHGALVRRNELYVYPLERRRGLPRSLDMFGWVLKWSTIDHGDPGTLGHRNLVRRCSKQVLEQFAPPFFTCLRNFHVHDPVTVRQPIQQLSWHKMWSPAKQNSLTFRLLPCTSYPVLFQFWNVSSMIRSQRGACHSFKEDSQRFQETSASVRKLVSSVRSRTHESWGSE